MNLENRSEQGKRTTGSRTVRDRRLPAMGAWAEPGFSLFRMTRRSVRMLLFGFSISPPGVSFG